MPQKELMKPLPYIKALAKLIDIIKKRKPDWDIFHAVGEAQRLIRSNKQWLKSTGG